MSARSRQLETTAPRLWAHLQTARPESSVFKFFAPLLLLLRLSRHVAQLRAPNSCAASGHVCGLHTLALPFSLAPIASYAWPPISQLLFNGMTADRLALRFADAQEKRLQFYHLAVDACSIQGARPSRDIVHRNEDGISVSFGGLFRFHSHRTVRVYEELSAVPIRQRCTIWKAYGRVSITVQGMSNRTGPALVGSTQ